MTRFRGSNLLFDPTGPHMEVVWAFKRNCSVYCHSSTGQTGWGKCRRIHKSTDTMMYPTFFQCLVDTMPFACLCSQGGMKTHSVRLTLRVTQTGRPHSQPDFTLHTLHFFPSQFMKRQQQQKT